MVYNNILGTKNFHPLARRSLLGTTSSIKNSLQSRISTLSTDVRERAVSYLRYKESISSFEIEQEQDKLSEIRTWCNLLRNIKDIPLDTAKGALSVAASIFSDQKDEYEGWRTDEVFVGSTKESKRGIVTETIHHIGAKVCDLTDLMDGFYFTINDCISFSKHDFSTYHPLLKYNFEHFDPISIIAILALSFTIIHPLVDGNGRSHRLLIHFLLEQFGVLDSWLLPISIIILHDNLHNGAKEKVLKEVSDPIIHYAKYHFNDGKLVIENDTKIFFESWDATNAVEYIYCSLEKSVRLSIDCTLYIQIWDACLGELVGTQLSHSQLKMIISRYLQSRKLSNNTLKRLAKKDIDEEKVRQVADVCARFLKEDPSAFKELFEPFNMKEQYNGAQGGY